MRPVSLCTAVPWTAVEEWNHGVQRARSAFARSGAAAVDLVRPVILRSWERSRERGVDGGLSQAPLGVPPGGLAALLGANGGLADAARPILTDLQSVLAGSGHVVTLCDPQARVLEVWGDPRGVAAAERIRLVPGADWSEAGAGTNAMGTALAEGRAVLVLGSEHFCAGWEHWACAAAPVLDPLTGQVLGVVDISAECAVMNEQTVAAALSTARAVEGRLFQEQMALQYRLLAAYAEGLTGPGNAAVLLFDGRGHLQRAVPAGTAPTPAHLRLVADTLASGRPQNDWLPTESGLAEAVCQPVWHHNRALGAVLQVRTAHRWRSPAPEPASLPGLVGTHPAFTRVMAQARQAAATAATVLITGETGTGKELLARAVHDLSPRAGGPFVAVNCAALPPSLAASELFGYAAGAFTGAAPRGAQGKLAAAHGGTLFLDEVGELPPEVQGALLRALESREVVRLGASRPQPVDVRIVAATNRDLVAEVASGRFRADLFYRLNVVTLRMPPLRERPSDVPALVQHTLTRLGVPDYPAPPEALHRLQGYAWPGNVRELCNAVERAVVLGEPLDACLPAPALPGPATAPAAGDLAAAERQTILAVLAECGGNASQAAHRLGIARSTLYRKLGALGVRLGREVQRR